MVGGYHVGAVKDIQTIEIHGSEWESGRCPGGSYQEKTGRSEEYAARNFVAMKIEHESQD